MIICIYIYIYIYVDVFIRLSSSKVTKSVANNQVAVLDK